MCNMKDCWGYALTFSCNINGNYSPAISRSLFHSLFAGTNTPTPFALSCLLRMCSTEMPVQ